MPDNMIEILNTLKRLNDLSDWDRIPIPLANKLDFNVNRNTYTGYTVSLEYDADNLCFIFRKDYGGEESERISFGVDELINSGLLDFENLRSTVFIKK